jgi:protoheme IX farnesyltransferase
MNSPTAVARSVGLKDYLALAKVRITIAVTLTAGTGYLAAAGTIDFMALFAALGVFLLASGASALNQLQEIRTDAKMNRTQDRPLVTGKITKPSALAFIALLVSSGLAIAYLAGGIQGLILNLMAIVWYNGIYTPLKKVTPFAVVPGAVIGAIPPVIGWVAAGGSIGAFSILAIALYFFVWQIPHFWLLMALYSKDYKQGGFPVLDDSLSEPQIKRITFLWISLTALSAVFAQWIFAAEQLTGMFILALASFWLVLSAGKDILAKYQAWNPKKGFMQINIYTLIFMFNLAFVAFMQNNG